MSDKVPPLTREEAITKVTNWYRSLFAPGQIIELRALDVQRSRERPHTEGGFFDTDHLRELAVAAFDVTQFARGVYATMNPLRPELLARRANRIAWAKGGELAHDKDVLVRRWLLVDVDPVRDPHVSATDGEKAAALETVTAVREFLASRRWPGPILADSGNGYHLLYRVDLLAADGGMIERVLTALAAQFDTDRVKIDRTVFNPSRLLKLPGTLARKGDDMPDRPHRRAKILELPDR